MKDGSQDPVSRGDARPQSLTLHNLTAVLLLVYQKPLYLQCSSTATLLEVAQVVESCQHELPEAL